MNNLRWTSTEQHLPSGKATSVCRRYVIEWSTNNAGERFYNAYLVGNPRTHIDGSYDKDQVKRKCDQHSEKPNGHA